MSFTNSWINSYNSLMTLTQDPVSGKLSGTYRSTTGGTGTYDIVGWASLKNPTSSAGQTMAISILWRSNDGGKSDPSHEVSGMAGQVIAIENGQNLSLMHLFVETDPVGSKLAHGFYPDKLIFVPSNIKVDNNQVSKVADSLNPETNGIEGNWIALGMGEIISFQINKPTQNSTIIEGIINYHDGSNYPFVGFTDLYAVKGNLPLQGISFSSYLDKDDARTCISMAGYLDFSTNKIHLTRFSANSTSISSNYTQVLMENFEFVQQL